MKNSDQNKRLWLELAIIIFITIVCNTHLVFGGFENSLAYRTGQASQPSVWHLIIHPFVHAGWYHLFLDAGAFVLLYAGLPTAGTFKRVTCTALSGITSLFFINTFADSSAITTFCGLSGIAHGLMAYYGLDMVFSSHSKKTALLIFSSVGLKSLYEMITGQMLFSGMHLGFYGTPVPASHAGGFTGGTIAFILCLLIKKMHQYKNYIPMSNG